jgi:sorbitol/mannitol transport system substrate-binding protein
MGDSMSLSCELKLNRHRKKRVAISTMAAAIVVIVIIVIAGVAGYYLYSGMAPPQTTGVVPTTTSIIPTTTAAPVTVNIITFDQGLVWTDLWNATTNEPLAPLLEFERQYNININVEFDDEATVRQKVQADFASGAGRYDITLADTSNLLQVYGSSGQLYPLDQFYTQGSPNYTPSEFFNYTDFIPKALEACSYEGHLYALPYFTFASSFNYRADLFQKYKVQVPTTISEMMNVTLPALKAGMRADGTYGNVYPIALRGEPKETTALDVNAFIYGFGGTWFQGGYSTVAEVKAHHALPAFNSTAVVNAIKTYAMMGSEFSTPDTPSYDFSKEISLYQSGKAAILFPQSVNAFVAQKYGDPSITSKMAYAPTVVGPTGQAFDEIWSLAFGISKFTHNPTAAWLALTFLMSYPRQLYFAEGYFPNPSLLSVLLSPDLTKVWGKDTMQVMIDELARSNPHFIAYIPEANAINVKMGEVTSAVMAGQMTPQQAGQALQDYAYQLLLSDGYYS